MNVAKRLPKLIFEPDPLAREELVTSWLRNNEEPSSEENWQMVMEDLAECVCQGNKTRAHNLARLSLRSPEAKVRKWAYGAPQAFPDFHLAMDILLSLWPKEFVEEHLRAHLKKLRPLTFAEEIEIKNRLALEDHLNSEILSILGWENLFPSPLEENFRTPRKIITPTFDIDPSPTISLPEIRERRFDLIDRIDLRSLRDNLPRAMINSKEGPQLLSKYSDKIDQVFIDLGIVKVENGALTVGPNVTIPPMPEWLGKSSVAEGPGIGSFGALIMG